MALAFLRYGVKDEIPTRIVRGNDSDKLYKVRGNWWSSFLGDLEIATRRSMIPGELQSETDELCEWIKGLTFGTDEPESLRTTADIQRANDFIDRILAATGFADTPLDLTDLESPNR